MRTHNFLISIYALFLLVGCNQIAHNEKGGNMKIKINSIFVNDQDKALKFYTEILGFVKKEDIPIGKYRWLTVVSPEGPDDIELVLEPNANKAAKTFQKSIYEQGLPATIFEVDDIRKEYERLISKKVKFTQKPTQSGDVIIAVFDDTCGNLIQIYQKK